MHIDKIYKNPTPVAVAIIPVETIIKYVDLGIVLNDNLKLHQVLYGQRNIEPKLGMFALPGGFVNELERIETAGVREVKEETGLIFQESDFKLFSSEITEQNRVLVFGVTPCISAEMLPKLHENLKNTPSISEETQSFAIAGLNITQTAFSLHQKAVAQYLNEVNGTLIRQFIHYHDFPYTDVLIKRLKLDGYLSSDYVLA